MKKVNLRALMALLLIPVFMVSCNKDEDPDPVELIPKLDGLYVYGSNTVAESSTEPAAKMPRAKLNPDKSGGVDDMEGIYGKLIYIGGNSTIQFKEVIEEEGFDYGAPGGGTTSPGADVGNTDIATNMIHGTLEQDTDPISIADEGLYYVFVNMNNMEFRIMKVEAHMIGDATEAQWAAGTPLPMIHVSVDSAVFEGQEIPLVGASGYKYMFNNGWEVYAGEEMATYTHLGVESYGDAWETGINDVGYYPENIPHKEDGIFTVRLKYDAASGEWDETKVKTGSMLIDYSANQMGLFGNAYLLAPGDTANWETGVDGYEVHAPDVTGNVYTWSWDAVELLEEREFIFLENGAWGGLQFDWAMLTSVEGEAVDNDDIVDATTVGGEYHNFYVVTGGTYDISLVIDAETESKTVTISNAVGK